MTVLDDGGSISGAESIRPDVGVHPVRRSDYRRHQPAGGELVVTDAFTQRFAEYLARGDYHRELDENWPYLPVYLEKMRRVRRFLEGRRHLRILDVGCGEGVLVEEYRRKGYDIAGLDLNFTRPGISRGSVLDMPFNDDSFDLLLCLDVIEHLNLMDQPTAIAEMHRVLRPGGVLLASIPNLAHFASRLRFVSLGKLIRTSEVARHPGDRPYAEHHALLSAAFVVEKSYGLFPTYPLISLLTYKMPARVIWLHRIYNAIFAYPAWCFLNIFECRKRDG